MTKKNESWNATGRRKSSVARVMMSSGNGSFIINKGTDTMNPKNPK